MGWSRVSRLAALVLVVTFAAPVPGAAIDEFEGLSNELEELRVALSIPGMAAAVVDNGSLVWSAGFGESDVETGEPVTPSTPFGLASVTKPIAATLLMQLVEEGLLGLDDPVEDYGVTIPNAAGVTIRQLLTHTSEGTPGQVHRYNGNRYAYLGGVIEGATGQTFARQLGERILLPLDMEDSALNPINAWGGVSRNGLEEFRYALGWGEPFHSYPDVYGGQASPYQLDESFSVVDGMWQVTHSPAAGMLSTVEDLAQFEIALTNGELLGEDSQAEMFRTQVATYPDRHELGYGLGWYIQEYHGMVLHWHTGRWPPSTSALYLRVPELELAFFVLANTDNLTTPFPWLGDGDVTGSALALAFIRHVVNPRIHRTDLPAIDWAESSDVIAEQLAVAGDAWQVEFLERELLARRQAYGSSGMEERVTALAAAARTAYPSSTIRMDWHYVSTVEGTAAVPTSMGPEGYTWIARVVLAWMSLVVVSLLWMVVRLLRAEERTVHRWLVWLVAALVLGPVSLTRLTPPVTVRAGLYGMGWALALALLMIGGSDPNPAMVLGSTLLIPWFFGVLLAGAPVSRRAGASVLTASRKSVLGEFILWGSAFALMLPVTFLLGNRVVSSLPTPSSPYFLLFVSLAALAGLATVSVAERRLRRAGVATWVEDDPSSMVTATWRNSWRLVAGIVATMVVSLVLTIAWLA